MPTSNQFLNLKGKLRSTEKGQKAEGEYSCIVINYTQNGKQIPNAYRVNFPGNPNGVVDTNASNVIDIALPRAQRVFNPEQVQNSVLLIMKLPVAKVKELVQQILLDKEQVVNALLNATIVAIPVAEYEKDPQLQIAVKNLVQDLCNKQVPNQVNIQTIRPHLAFVPELFKSPN